MAGSIFSKIKSYLSLGTLTNEELNAELNNIHDNGDARGWGGHSDTVAQMQLQTDPGDQGSESLATAISDEIERIRFAIKNLTGETYWYDDPDDTIAGLNTTLNSLAATPPTRITAGESRSADDSGAPIFLVPNGSNNTVALQGSVTTFQCRIDGSLFTSTSDPTTTLTQAPSSQNTALVDDTSLAGAEITKIQGERNTVITIDTVGTEISNRVGLITAFKINNGVDDEYFIARVKSATELSEARRGYFQDSSQAAVDRITINNNDTITLLTLSHIFYKNDDTIFSTNNELYNQSATPTSPSTGDMWWDVVNQTWNTYNGAAWVASDAIYVGMALTDSSNTIAARSENVFAVYNDLNNIRLNIKDSTTLEAQEVTNGSRVSVEGTEFDFSYNSLEWDITNDLESGESESSSTTYEPYISYNGKPKLSTKRAQWDPKRRGWYHPQHNWLSVGYVFNDSSSDFASVGDYNSSRIQTNVLSADVNTTGVIADFTFTNLFIGQKYKVHYQLYMLLNGTGEDADVSFRDGTTQVARMQFQQVGSQAEISTRSGSFTFKATASTFDVNVVSMTVGGTILGNSTRGGSFVILEELPFDLLETTQH